MDKTSLMLALVLGTSSSAIFAEYETIKEPEVKREKLQANVLFSGKTLVRDTKKKDTVRIENVGINIHNWGIDGGQHIEALPLPEKGTTLVQLRSGELTTIIDGKKEARHEGEFWTVPADTPMGIITGSDSAIIQTVIVEKP